ncbi:MAG: SAM-dependent methyltransferase, partial [candidate division KSB1 bacterium]|nr:SAM-dependent methyltransferase [candidate division KSB1 bacterium]
SDSAFYLIREAIREAIAVTMVPGATAFVPALVLSGLATDTFVFEGFLPVKKGRRKRLQELVEEKRTLIFYESPRRLLKTLDEFLAYFGDRKVALVKELTKKFEQVYRGKISQVRVELTEQQPRGEWIIVLEGKGK